MHFCLFGKAEDGGKKKGCSENTVLEEMLPSGQHKELRTCSAWVQRSREPSQPEQGLLAPSLGWVPAQVIALCPLKFLPAVSTECYFILFFFLLPPLKINL